MKLIQLNHFVFHQSTKKTTQERKG